MDEFFGNILFSAKKYEYEFHTISDYFHLLNITKLFIQQKKINSIIKKKKKSLFFLFLPQKKNRKKTADHQNH